ncbi:MAG: hypothetical protein AAFV43_15495 [Planctomycetota bacterium]
MLFRLACSLVVGAVTLSSANAQESLLDPGPQGNARQEGWAYEQSVAPATPTQIIQRKAQSRGAERASRLAAQQWYGYTPARPRSTATPFSGLYGSQFQGRMVGRPAAHYPTRPVIVVTK